MRKILAITIKSEAGVLKKEGEQLQAENSKSIIVEAIKTADPFQKLIKLSSKAICFSRNKKIEKELIVLNDSLGKEEVNKKIQELLAVAKTSSATFNYL